MLMELTCPNAAFHAFTSAFSSVACWPLSASVVSILTGNWTMGIQKLIRQASNSGGLKKNMAHSLAPAPSPAAAPPPPPNPPPPSTSSSPAAASSSPALEVCELEVRLDAPIEVNTNTAIKASPRIGVQMSGKLWVKMGVLPICLPKRAVLVPGILKYGDSAIELSEVESVESKHQNCELRIRLKPTRGGSGRLLKLRATTSVELQVWHTALENALTPTVPSNAGMHRLEGIDSLVLDSTKQLQRRGSRGLRASPEALARARLFRSLKLQQRDEIEPRIQAGSTDSSSPS